MRKIDREATPIRHEPDTAGTDDRVVVEWDVRLSRRLRTMGLSRSILDPVDVVVVDRRGGETTPSKPGELVAEGSRVVVVPDRSDGAPPVEVWVAGGRDTHGGVVEVVRRSVEFDAVMDAAFESARGDPAVGPGDDGSADDGPTTHPIQSVISSAAGVDTALAVGGFAGVVEPIE